MGLLQRDLLFSLDAQLFEERGMSDQVEALKARKDTIDEASLWRTFRALVNTRPPLPAAESFLREQDQLLQSMIAQAGVTTVDDTIAAPHDPAIRLWRGDITTLAADGIVNAANSQMLGCWQPGHHCIDNAIHTFAACSCASNARASWKSKDAKSRRGRRKSRPHTTCPRDSSCTP